MKILKIDAGSGYYRLDMESEWLPIDSIDKSGLLGLLKLFLNDDVEMDPYDEEKLQNQTHQIIYRSISEKLFGILDKKDMFKDEADRMFMAEYEKYSQI